MEICGKAKGLPEKFVKRMKTGTPGSFALEIVLPLSTENARETFLPLACATAYGVWKESDL